MYYIYYLHSKHGMLLLTRCPEWPTVKNYAPTSIHPYEWPKSKFETVVLEGKEIEQP